MPMMSGEVPTGTYLNSIWRRGRTAFGLLKIALAPVWSGVGAAGTRAEGWKGTQVPLRRCDHRSSCSIGQPTTRIR